MAATDYEIKSFEINIGYDSLGIPILGSYIYGIRDKDFNDRGKSVSAEMDPAELTFLLNKTVTQLGPAIVNKIKTRETIT